MVEASPAARGSDGAGVRWAAYLTGGPRAGKGWRAETNNLLLNDVVPFPFLLNPLVTISGHNVLASCELNRQSFCSK